MTQVHRTLRVTAADRGVLGVVMDAPPMNLIGPELVRDLVTLSGALESGVETRVVVLESAECHRTTGPPQSSSAQVRRTDNRRRESSNNL